MKHSYLGHIVRNLFGGEENSFGRFGDQAYAVARATAGVLPAVLISVDVYVRNELQELPLGRFDSPIR